MTDTATLIATLKRLDAENVHATLQRIIALLEAGERMADAIREEHASTDGCACIGECALAAWRKASGEA